MILVVNQFTIIENSNNKRPDLILFVNGLPLVLFELRSTVDENATLLSAYKQIQTYKATISICCFKYFCVLSDLADLKRSISLVFTLFGMEASDGIKAST